MASEEHLDHIALEDEMRSSYMAYAMSVIVGRALPDARDGLKPVHRRTLYAMNEMGLASNRAYRKSAKIVGEIMATIIPTATPQFMTLRSGWRKASTCAIP